MWSYLQNNKKEMTAALCGRMFFETVKANWIEIKDRQIL